VKCIRSRHSYINVGYKNFACECDQAEETDPGGKGLDMGTRCLVSWDTSEVLSALSFTDSDGVRYFDQGWLRKATDIVEARENII
jgi:hypothetical protein